MSRGSAEAIACSLGDPQIVLKFKYEENDCVSKASAILETYRHSKATEIIHTGNGIGGHPFPGRRCLPNLVLAKPPKWPNHTGKRSELTITECWAASRQLKDSALSLELIFKDLAHF